MIFLVPTSPSVCFSLLHYLGKPKQVTCTLKWTKIFNKFYIFGPVSFNSQSVTLFDCHAAVCLLDDLQECWWIPKSEWWSLDCFRAEHHWHCCQRKEKPSLCLWSRNGLTLLTFFYCRQLKKQTIGWTIRQLTEMRKNVFYALFWLSNDASFDKNTIFCWFCFPR